MARKSDGGAGKPKPKGGTGSRASGARRPSTAPGQSDADLNRNLRTLYRQNRIAEGGDPKKLDNEGQTSFGNQLSSRLKDLDPFKGQTSVSLSDYDAARRSGKLRQQQEGARGRLQADAQEARQSQAKQRQKTGPANRSAAAKKAALTRKAHGKR